MGQKVNPHGLRVGVIKDWDSRWFTTDKKEFGNLLLEDHNVRNFLKKRLYSADLSISILATPAEYNIFFKKLRKLWSSNNKFPNSFL